MLIVVLISTCLAGHISTAKAQVWGDSKFTEQIPCQSLAAMPNYMQAFIHWVNQKAKKDVITVQTTNLTDGTWARIQLHSLKLKAFHYIFDLSDSYEGTINGYLNVSGTCSSSFITGQIKLGEGYVRLSNFGVRSLQNVPVDTSAAQVINQFDSLRIDVQLQMGNEFYLYNERFLPLSAELVGTLQLVKKIDQHIHATGTLHVLNGYTKPLGQTFNLVEGMLTFSGPIDDPQLYLRNKFEPRHAELDIKIWYEIKGTVEKPTFEFYSTPTMDLKDILSYTLFNQPFYRLASIEQNLVRSVATQTAADKTTDVLLSKMEVIATSKLSVDVVRIDNTTAESGTVITTGWYLQPDVFFAVQNIIAGRPKVGFYLEYYLTENLKLILSQDNDYGQGIDIEYQYDY